jgi:hypothetical protein
VEVFEPAFTRGCPQSQSQNYFTTGGLPPISSSSQLNTCGRSPYIASSLTRGWIYRLQLLLVLASSFILGSESRGTRDHILLSQIRDFPFVASNDSQGSGGGIRPRHQTGRILGNVHGLESSLYSPGADSNENTAPSSSSIVVMDGCLATAQILSTFLPAVTKQRMFLLAIIA